MGGLAVLILLGLVSMPHIRVHRSISRFSFWVECFFELSHFLFEAKKFGSITMRWRADLIQIFSVIWTFDVKLLIESLCPWHLCVCALCVHIRVPVGLSVCLWSQFIFILQHSMGVLMWVLLLLLLLFSFIQHTKFFNNS